MNITNIFPEIQTVNDIIEDCGLVEKLVVNLDHFYDFTVNKKLSQEQLDACTGIFFDKFVIHKIEYIGEVYE